MRRGGLAAYVLTGGDDLIIHVAVPDVDELHSFLIDRLSDRREIVSFRSSVVFQHDRKRSSHRCRDASEKRARTRDPGWRAESPGEDEPARDSPSGRAAVGGPEPCHCLTACRTYRPRGPAAWRRTSSPPARH
ncbi:Lrp/AsnC ligand binding domain-containing protein [Streptomyces sp. M92]|uniref:Lrp/AsnC ligand binding domain-containing protein n=1 Tax=Streptomyces sp. M92 TaxID=2944250 RepID=UPI00234BD984|nr:Lrp/AsnC ligand binding domain-containing protein [Streptomyces sp. M92]WCN05112.1 Lrp/AsnC ligand binding domain-containing protein [Streptomyces sp. M92]